MLHIDCGQAFINADKPLKHQKAGTSSEADYFIQFVPKSPSYRPVMDKVSAQRESTVILAELKDFSIQWTIRIIHDDELPLKFVNYESRYMKNCSVSSSAILSTESPLIEKVKSQGNISLCRTTELMLLSRHCVITLCIDTLTHQICCKNVADVFLAPDSAGNV